MKTEPDTTTKQAAVLRAGVLAPLHHAREYYPAGSDWSRLRIDLEDLLDSVDLLYCCDLDRSELQDLADWEDDVLARVDQEYQAIMRCYDDVVAEEEIISMKAEH